MICLHWYVAAVLTGFGVFGLSCFVGVVYIAHMSRKARRALTELK